MTWVCLLHDLHFLHLEEPVLHVHDLYYTYPDGRKALHGVTMHVLPGEKVALVGPNGAGKSTLMLHFNGILNGGKGQVHVDGMPVTEKNLGNIRARVGLVFQNPDDQLFSMSVFEDVAFGPLHMGYPEDEVRRRVQQALDRVGIPDFGPRMPHHLSVGERKRVAIATVLAMEPSILVLDEPTAGLDPRARRSLITLLRELDATMLVSTHDMRLVAELFPRTIVLDEGRIVADGPTGEIMADAALLETHGLEAPWDSGHA